jgi:hypothetical protein
MSSRLHTFCLRALKGGLELVLAACGWRWNRRLSLLLDGLTLRLEEKGAPCGD